jgi:hypothetical protein
MGIYRGYNGIYPLMMMQHDYHWIGLRENRNRKAWFLPSNSSGFPVIFFPYSNSMRLDSKDSKVMKK